METTIFLAKAMSVFLLAVSLGYFLNPKHYTSLLKEYAKSKSTLFLHGYFELVLGFLLVTNHNIWVHDWTVLVTLVAWGFLIEGLLMLLFPEGMMGFAKSMNKKNNGVNFVMLVMLVLGAILAYHGFGF